MPRNRCLPEGKTVSASSNRFASRIDQTNPRPRGIGDIDDGQRAPFAGHERQVALQLDIVSSGQGSLVDEHGEDREGRLFGGEKRGVDEQRQDEREGIPHGSQYTPQADHCRKAS